jgi:hypothetical protein
MSLRLAFHSNQLSITGTEVALYDYALHNENVLGNRSVVIYPANSPHSHRQAEEKFRQRFELLSYRTHVEMDALLLQHGVDLLYAIKSGKRDGLLSRPWSMLSFRPIRPTYTEPLMPTFRNG